MEAGRRLFTAVDLRVARFFAERTVNNEGGQVGAVLITLPREVAARMRAAGVLTRGPVPDMPNVTEWIFQPGAAEWVKNFGTLQALPAGTLGQ
jgi:hypothetical protein